jgi:hypothetical protein
MLVATKLAVIAAEGGDAERAGRLWGAIGTNETSGPVRGWEDSRKEYEPLVLRADGPPFARARTEGHLLSIAEAAGLDSRQRGTKQGRASKLGGSNEGPPPIDPKL